MAGSRNEIRRYAVAPDGSPLFYEMCGADDPIATIVMSDGIGCDGYVWKYLRRDLAQQYRLLHWHYPGHGRSPQPRGPAPSIGELADDIAVVLDDAGVDRAILFGHSMGVQVTLEAYRRHGRRFDALVLLCGMAANPLSTFRGGDHLESVLPAVRYAVDRAPMVFRQLARALLPTRLAYSVAEMVEVNGLLLDPGDFMPYLRGLSHVHPDYFLALLAEAGMHSAIDVLPDVSVPTLVVAGDRDGFTPAALSREIAAAIPDAELLLVEGGTHTAPLERPQLVGQAVADFLQRRVVARSRAAGDSQHSV